MKLKPLAEIILKKKITLILEQVSILTEKYQEDFSNLTSGYFVINPKGEAKEYKNHGYAVFDDDIMYKEAMNIYNDDESSLKDAADGGEVELYALMYRHGYIRAGSGGWSSDSIPWFSFSPKHVKSNALMTLLSYLKFKNKKKAYIETNTDEGYHDSDDDYTVDEIIEKFL